jgi:hypothetical protein
MLGEARALSHFGPLVEIPELSPVAADANPGVSTRTRKRVVDPVRGKP